jgi:phage tail-like protein
MDLTKHLPRVQRRVDSTRNLVEVLTTAVTGMTDDIAEIIQQRDLQRADRAYLDLLLFEIGWPIDVEMTTNQKRKTLKTAVDLYLRKGEKGGAPIIELALELLGVTITIVEGIDGGWRIGLSLLGIDTRLGSDTYKWWFYIHAPTTLSAANEADITKIADALKPLFASYKIIKDL